MTLINDKILQYIDLAKIETEKISNSNVSLKINKDPLLTTREMLDWLKKEITENSNNLNPNLILRFRKQGVVAFKEYENTLLETYLTKILDLLQLLIQDKNSQLLKNNKKGSA
jgi:uncharacterized protein YicC (UPF0701 family)